jgi:ribosomal protein S13
MNNQFHRLIQTTKGLKTSQVRIITDNFGFNERKNYKYATELHENQLLDTVSTSITNLKLDKLIADNIAFLKKLKVYRGIRHKKGLPVRGQRTHTNSKTRKRLAKLSKHNIKEYANKPSKKPIKGKKKIKFQKKK